MAEGADVQVAMTRAAASFVSPLVLQTLSRSSGRTRASRAREDAAIGHIRIAEEADVVLVAPATADLVARMALGMADDIVTAALLVARCPVVVAPSMNTNMLAHPAVRGTSRACVSFGYRIVESDRGELACGYEGAGRLPDADALIAEVAAALAPNRICAGGACWSRPGRRARRSTRCAISRTARADAWATPSRQPPGGAART